MEDFPNISVFQIQDMQKNVKCLLFESIIFLLLLLFANQLDIHITKLMLCHFYFCFKQT